MSHEIKDGDLSMKQKLFCKYYLEEHGNGTKAYARAYESKNIDSARKLASKLINNPVIQKTVNDLVEESGLNDRNIDKQLGFLITQFQNLSVKLRAIKEYNKMTGRYKKESKKKDRKELYDFSNMTMKELEKRRQELLKE